LDYIEGLCLCPYEKIAYLRKQVAIGFDAD
jgi:hypothetical protein